MSLFYKKTIKLLFFYFSVKLIICFFSWILDFNFLGILKLENVATSDLSLNDLYYPIRDKTNGSDLDNIIGEKVIVINTGSIDTGCFRLNLANLLLSLKTYNPKIIAIDHTFESEDKLGTEELSYVINASKNIILAKKENTKSTLILGKQVEYGSVDFPDDQHTIRRYYSYPTTFAAKVAEKISNSSINYNFPADSFFINYVFTSKDVLTVNDTSLFLRLKKIYKIEAADILNRDSIALEFLKKYASNNALLLGHLGYTNSNFNPENDIEDKYAVPCDSSMVNRQKTMSGLMIHVNAIENLINKENRFFCFSDNLLFKCLIEILILLFLWFLLYFNYGKVANVFILFLFSLPVLYIVLFLMHKFNVYIEIGLTLLQLLVYEELTELIEPVYEKISKFKLLKKFDLNDV